MLKTNVLARLVWAAPDFVHNSILRRLGLRVAQIVYMPSGQTFYRWEKGDSFVLDMEDIPDMAEGQDD